MQTAPTPDGAAPSDPAIVRAGRRRALLAEDAPLNRRLVKALLERGAFEVRLAGNGREAVEAVAAGETFDVVLLDLDMPVMDGFAAAAAIRGLGGARGGVPIVALAAAARPAEAVRARAAGMSGAVTKPFDPATFVRAVEGAMAGRPTRPARPVWNRRSYDALCRRLGGLRVASCLDLFEAQLRRARAGLSCPDVSTATIAWEAHAFVSSAGILGFDDLCAVSQDAQDVSIRPVARPPDGGAGGCDAAVDLLGAIDQALACLAQADAVHRAGGAGVRAGHAPAP